MLQQHPKSSTAEAERTDERDLSSTVAQRSDDEQVEMHQQNSDNYTQDEAGRDDANGVFAELLLKSSAVLQSLRGDLSSPQHSSVRLVTDIAGRVMHACGTALAANKAGITGESWHELLSDYKQAVQEAHTVAQKHDWTPTKGKITSVKNRMCAQVDAKQQTMQEVLQDNIKAAAELNMQTQW